MDRTGFLGGSDMPVILGLPDVHSNRIALWAEKRGIDLLEPWQREENEAFLADGKMCEPMIATRFVDERDDVHCLLKPPVYTHSVYSFLKGSPDGIVQMVASGDRVAEIKCVDRSMVDRWVDGVPLKFQAQTQFYMLVTGIRRAFVIRWTYGGKTLPVYEIEFNERFCDHMVAEACKFWELVESGVEPEPAGDWREVDALRALHKQTHGALKLPHAALNIANQWEAEKSAKLKHEHAAKGLEAKLRGFMKSKAIGLLPDNTSLTLREQGTTPHYQLNGIFPDGENAFKTIPRTTTILRRSRT